MKEESISFALTGIKTEQFAAFEHNLPKDKKADLTTALEFKVDKKERRIATYAKFVFAQSENVFLTIQVCCFFMIKPSAWQRYSDDSKVVFPKNFLAHLAMLTIGSARGVLHAKTENTEFNDYMIPTINVNKIVKKEIEFPLDD